MATEHNNESPAGKTIVITGASGGIGAAAAKHLSDQGANVIITGRSPSKTEAVANDLGVEPLLGDYADFAQVRELAQKINDRVDHIDVLVNNAGGMFKPSLITADGHEPNFQINHLSTFLLTKLLHDKLAAAPAPRMIVTSSLANNAGKIVIDDLDYERRRAIEFRAYGTGKLMNILFARELAKRWAPENITGTAFHPGLVASEFGRDNFLTGILYRTPLKRLGTIEVEKGATPITDLATRPDRDEINSVFFNRHKPSTQTTKQATDTALMTELWEKSEELVSG
jgi:NAD(P)-dependent dehydrogenase (short-subunit alcohol dehydrogenase family)